MTPQEEALADAALLSLFKLRDSLSARDADVRRADEVLTALEGFARAQMEVM